MRKSVRKWLGIDTWGMDLFRVKRRLGTVVQDLDELTTAHDETVTMIDRNTETVEDWLTNLELRIGALETGNYIPEDDSYPVRLDPDQPAITSGEES